MASAAAVLVSNSSMHQIVALGGPSSESITTADPAAETAAAAAVITTTTNTTATEKVCGDSDEKRCRGCHSRQPLYTDWAAGDLVCTNCGMVDQGHLMETGPEWREYNDDDGAGGTGAGHAVARCGLVPNDESRYWGGLQPTSLGRGTVGAANHASNPALYQKLNAARHRMNRRMEKMHNQQLTNAKLERQLRQKRRRQGRHPMDDTSLHHPDGGILEENDDTAQEDSNKKEDELLLQKQQQALFAEKWSLSRAIRLFGAEHEQSNTDNGPGGGGADNNDESLSNNKRVDETLQRAAREMYLAHSILQDAANRLQLPDRATQQAVSLLCRYAVVRDGFSVRGIASTLQRKKQQQQQPRGGRAAAAAAAERAAAQQALREYNTMKQMGALSAALLFWVARHWSHPRTLVQVCESIRVPSAATATTTNSTPPHQQHLDVRKEAFIKKKHSSKAMAELKESLPDVLQLVHSSSQGGASAKTAPTTAATASARPSRQDEQEALTNFCDHALRKLHLPPVAQAAVRCLVWRQQQQQQQQEKATSSTSPKQLSVVCGAVAYFVCQAGQHMQRLANQSQSRSVVAKTPPPSSSRNSNQKKKGANTLSSFTSWKSSSEAPSAKRIKLEGGKALKKNEALASRKQETDSDSSGADSEKPFHASQANSGGTDSVADALFDTSLDESEWNEFTAEQHAYEMRRMWDAWTEQLPWTRTLTEVENCCGASQKLMIDYYQKQLHGKRNQLLTHLQDAVGAAAKSNASGDASASTTAAAAADESCALRETPLASILLSRFAAAGPLMKKAGKW